MKPVSAANSPETDDTGMVVPDFVIESLARGLLPTLRAFYDSSEGQTAFERWKAEQEKNAE